MLFFHSCQLKRGRFHDLQTNKYRFDYRPGRKLIFFILLKKENPTWFFYPVGSVKIILPLPQVLKCSNSFHFSCIFWRKIGVFDSSKFLVSRINTAFLTINFLVLMLCIYFSSINLLFCKFIQNSLISIDKPFYGIII